MLNRKDLFELIETTLLQMNLTGAVIEKDYYVTYVIQALSGIENENFRLVFAGGTCLAKAHRIVNRMSEDVDFKIQIKNNQIFSRSALSKKLKEFRSQINSVIDNLNLTTIENIPRNEGKYQKVLLEYPYLYSPTKTLRPNILLEFTFANIRFPIENLLIKTIIEDNLNNINLYSSQNTRCISVDETAIEKWVGLTRRVSAIERNRHPEDEALIRHLYDLNYIHHANKINDNLFKLAKDTVIEDAKQFKNQHPEYASDPTSEIIRSIDILRTKSYWKENYNTFVQNMVFEPSSAPEYENALSVVEDISNKVLALL